MIYSELKAELDKVPVTYLPGLIRHLCLLALRKRLFNPHRLSDFVRKIELEEEVNEKA